MRLRQPVKLLLANYPPLPDCPGDKCADCRRGKLDILRAFQMQKACLVFADGPGVNQPGQHHAEPAFHHRQRRPGRQIRIAPGFHAERGNPGFNELLAPQLSRSGQLPQQKFL